MRLKSCSVCDRPVLLGDACPHCNTPSRLLRTAGALSLGLLVGCGETAQPAYGTFDTLDGSTAAAGETETETETGTESGTSAATTSSSGTADDSSSGGQGSSSSGSTGAGSSGSGSGSSGSGSTGSGSSSTTG